MRKKLIGFMSVILAAFFFCTSNVMAEEAAMTKKDLNIVFAVDHSGSMNKQDAQRMIPEMLKVFADTMHSENVRIGYVAYNDTIVARHAPVSIQTAGQRELLKEAIESADNRGETDIGLGLREAYHLMDGSSGRKMIVLISDGETDLGNSNTGRTEQDSDRDMQEVMNICREEGTPIVTVAFGEEYEGEDAVLKNISAQTGGESYTAQKPEDLINIFYDLFHTNFTYTVYEAGDSIYGEGRQRVNYESKGGYFEELTILLLSDKEIKQADIEYGSRKIQPELMGNYAVAGMIDASGALAINFDTVTKQRVSIFMIGRRNITPVAEWTGEIYKNKPLDFQIYFTEGKDSRIEDEEYYSSFDWYAEFQNMQNGNTIPVQMKQNGGVLTGSVNFEESGKYKLFLDTGSNAENTYEVSDLTVLNTLPDSIPAGQVEMLTVTTEQMINLNDYFEDADNDSLTFKLKEVPTGIATASVEEHFLHIKPQGRGSGEIVLLVSDGEGSLLGRVPVRVKSLPEAYWEVPLLAAVILIFCLIKLYTRKKKIVIVPDIEEEKKSCYFTGKVNAYFTLLPDGQEEIPPLTFALHHIREKKIVLGDMFKNHAELSDLLELDNVFLYPAENRKIILYHNSNATIMIGSSIVCRKMQYAIGYGNVIYITSQDGTCELEVHYISMI